MDHRGSPRFATVPPGPRRTLRARLRAFGSVATVVALTVSGLAFSTLAGPAASAAPGPVQTAGPGVVTAEALPTAQINGVVWSQAVVGNTVYAGGNFTKARPAGAAAGTQEVARTHLMSYDLTTGVMTSFAPVLNGQVKSVVASPDGTRLYVGGEFTTINGGTRSRIAAFDLTKPTPELVTGFLASADYTVNAVAATNSTVYIGGDFNNARGVARKKLAAFRVSDGSLLGWAPTADSKVNALLMTPDQSKVVIGGAFAYLNGAAAYGSAMVDAATGASKTWKANSLIRNYGTQASILGLSTDGTNIYVNGYVWVGTGNLEGAFAASPADGTIKWIEDCHGDSYGTYAPGNNTDVVYVVSHAHYCGNVGGQPQTDPWSYQRGMAFTKSVQGTLTNNGDRVYYDFSGNPSPSIVSWFPLIAMGSFTGQYQGAWNVTGNDQYVVIGGEFPSVNGMNQQGLARFAVQPISKGTKPVYSGANMVPTISTTGAGAIRATLTTNWDRDDSLLSYQLVRDGKVVNTGAASSTFWNRGKVTISDSGLTAGTTYKYQIVTVDSAGNTATGNQVSYTAPATGGASVGGYAQVVGQQGASAYWRLGESSGAIYDWAGTNDGALAAGTTRNQSGAINGDTNAAVAFNGTDSGRMSTKTALTAPQVYSVEAWFKTTTTSGGKIVGFGSSSTGNSGSYDRQIYMDNSGKLIFGNYAGASKTVATGKSYNDGQWHQAVGTLGPDGMTLYVDGAKIATDPTTTSAVSYSGYWRLGGDNVGGWPSTPASANFNGTIDEFSVYPRVLTDAQVLAQYQASGQAPNSVPTAAFTTTNTFLAVNFDGSTSADSDGTIASYSWNFGDGTAAGTGAKPAHTYAAAGTYSVALTVTDNFGATNTVTKPVTVAANKSPSAAFTVTVNNLDLTVDGSTSADPDGTIASYSWDYGDGTTATGAKPATKTYATAGTRTVKLTVTDNAGATNVVTQQVTATNPPVNKVPVASFTTTPTDLTVAVNGTASADPDGTIASYAWDFGDSSTGTGVTASRTYAAAGTYTVKLTVTDDKGATGSTTKTVTVTAPPAPNQPPVAAFTATPTNLSVAFNGSTSKDTDGSIASYAWDFGDNSTGTGVSPTHAFAAAGTYTVKLTVTDNKGATGVVSNDVAVSAAPPTNKAPVAAFTSTVNGMAATVNGSGSADPDGTVASYAWDFGDNSTGTGATASHTFAAAGTYQVTLTVTDNQGATNSVQKPVTIAQGANQLPTAKFTSTVNNLAVGFDGSGSTDPDGTVASYAWDFGDTSTGTGANPSHTYAAAGTYQVKLSVTDNAGGVSSVTNPVTVAAAPPAAFASDEFGRTVAAGWSTADQGGAWTLGGSTSNFSVGGGTGVIKLAAAGAGPWAALNGVSQSNVDTTVDVALDKAPAGGPVYFSLAERRTLDGAGKVNDYRLKLVVNTNSTVTAQLTKVVGGTETAVGSATTISGLTYNAGDTLRLRLQVSGTGTTAVKGKVWKVGSAEPTTWLTGTDSTAALQVAGGVALLPYLSGAATNATVAVSIDNLTVQAIQ
ncbi:PKD domain-containing protein [Nakamurella sp.]|uniref:PKD domain-containing protein n=1 Tax=Nakamurella sp. TaxID=1869182 RepID=UPI0037832D80